MKFNQNKFKTRLSIVLPMTIQLQTRNRNTSLNKTS